MNTQRHLSKATRNEEFWNGLHDSEMNYPDWVVTGVFYSALHYIEAIFATRERHHTSHVRRDSAITNDRDLGSIWRDYRALKDRRLRASYDFQVFTPEEIDRKVIPRFRKVKDHVLKLLQKRVS